MTTASSIPPQSHNKIERQIQLPFRQAFKISLRNITIRLGRAAITAAGTFLGIAFLMSVCTSAIAISADPSAKALAHARFADASPLMFWLAPLKAINAQPDATLRARSIWLVSLSLLLCTAGITNTMLMFVTERFREIGTLKCLGALDGFIVKLFLIESALIGFCGSLAGALVGSGAMLMTYIGKVDWSKFDFATLLGCGVTSALLGMTISILAAVWPAVVAARLPAAAALRSEI